MLRTFLRKLSPSEKFLLALLLAALLALAAFLAFHIRAAERSGAFSEPPRVPRFLSGSRQSPEEPLSDPDKIEPWMTFRYVNVVFGIPEPYLKRVLDIGDSRYPDLPVGRYAKKVGSDRESFLAELKDAVRKFLSENERK